jgi:ribosomal protein L34E
VEKMKKSRSKKIIQKKSPKGRKIVRLEKRKKEVARCAICKREIVLSKNRKRPFNNVLCAQCTSKVLQLASRIERGELKLDDVEGKYRSYILQIFAH